MKQTESIEQGVEVRWDLGQQAFGFFASDLQITDSNALQLAQQPLNISRFCFGSPCNGQPGAEPVSYETQPDMIADSVGPGMKNRTHLQISLQLAEGILNTFEIFVMAKDSFFI